MKKGIIVAIIGVLFTCLVSAQETGNYKTKFYVEHNLLGIDVGTNLLVSKDLFVTMGFGVGAGYEVYTSNDSSHFQARFNFDVPVPYLRLGADWYYNKDRRIANGKGLKNNSGNYIGYQGKYSLGSNEEKDLNSVLINELHYGMRRSLGKVFYYKMQLGVGHASDFDSNKSIFTPVVGLFVGASF